MARNKRLGEQLVEWGVITPKEVQAALEHGKVKGLRLGEALVDLKMCNEAQVFKALAQQHNMEYVDVARTDLPGNATTLIPEDLIRKYLILPLGIENGRLRVVVHDPLDLEMLDILRFRLHKEMKPVLAPRSRIKELIDDL